MERYGYLIADSDGGVVHHTHPVLYTDLAICVKQGINQKVEKDKEIVYFKILRNSDVVKYLHDGVKDREYSFANLQQASPLEPYCVNYGASKINNDLFLCILDAKSTDLSIVDCTKTKI
ncbi:hypothetical protein AVEN_94789-1 [Araneus ventricosus]|uniref:Uncharacterized protein n=1 Tax=Araneus ventricosus TaxID=182803 RepID=A0A4Y2CP38_ARAVE|nr:hypothetical protein AVEN_94789-1 [Araneus ventricosus]